MEKTVVFTGGGTAGHVFPGIAVYRGLEKAASEKGIKLSLCWLGSSRGMERKIVENEGIPYIGLPAGKLRRYFSFRNFLDIFNIGAGFLLALFHLARLKPEVLFSKGGYVSVPPVLAARMLKIPVIAHESDTDPGLATRISSRFARKILVSLEETKECFPESFRSRIVVTGNPVREAVYLADRERGRKLIGLDRDTPFIIILGGSQGALQINELIGDIVPELVKSCIIVHQMGELTYKESELEGYETRKFISDELPDLIAASDLVVSRAGAATLWELAVLGKPMVLIPLGTGSSRGDQLKNAEIFRGRGAAKVFSGDIDTEDFKRTILNLIQDRRLLEEMGLNAKKLVSENSAVVISRMLLEYT